MEPMSLLSGGIAGGVKGGAGGSAGPSNALGGDSSFDASGWNVNFGAGSVSSSRSDMGQYLPYILAAAGVLIAWRLTRKK